MVASIPSKYADLLEKKGFASLATVMADGSPQVTPVWVMYEAPYVVVNSARGRLKDRNMRREPRVSLSIQDPENPYRYVGIRGHVERITEEDGRKVIDALASKYLGEDVYPGPPEEIRVTYRILPDKVWGMG